MTWRSQDSTHNHHLKNCNSNEDIAQGTNYNLCSNYHNNLTFSCYDNVPTQHTPRGVFGNVTVVERKRTMERQFANTVYDNRKIPVRIIITWIPDYSMLSRCDFKVIEKSWTAVEIMILRDDRVDGY